MLKASVMIRNPCSCSLDHRLLKHLKKQLACKTVVFIAGVRIVLLGMWQCLETFLVVTTRRMLEASSG